MKDWFVFHRIKWKLTSIWENIDRNFVRFYSPFETMCCRNCPCSRNEIHRTSVLLSNIHRGNPRPSPLIFVFSSSFNKCVRKFRISTSVVTITALVVSGVEKCLFTLGRNVRSKRIFSRFELFLDFSLIDGACNY